MLSAGAEREEMIERLLETYEVDRTVLERDCDLFLQTLKEKNILEA
jgi:hypothetical protein